MKISKKYILRINPMHCTATYGTMKYNDYISNVNITMGRIIDCNLSELKHNIRFLEKRNYKVHKFISK